jgi:hypothetical protein
LRVALGFLLIVLALALAAGAWWKLRQSSAPKAQAPPVAATVETQSEPALAPPVPEDEPAAGSDEKDSARTLVTGIYHVSSADSSSVIIDMQGEVQYEAHRLGSPERIYIDLHDTAGSRHVRQDH